jgi:hypothetical protein
VPLLVRNGFPAKSVFVTQYQISNSGFPGAPGRSLSHRSSTKN